MTGHDEKVPPNASFITQPCRISVVIDQVVLATDGSESVVRATTVALDLADRFEATVHALYVIDERDVSGVPDDVADELTDALEREGAQSIADIEARAHVPVVTAIRTGRPALEIDAYARSVDADLVAIGTRGRHGEHRYLLGSVAEAVIERCPMPVLVVRQLDSNDAKR